LTRHQSLVTRTAANPTLAPVLDSWPASKEVPMTTATGLLAVWMDPKPENEDDLNRWYSEEHLRERLDVPGFLSARRYVCEEGEHRYIALYRLRDAEVLHGEPYQ